MVAKQIRVLILEDEAAHAEAMRRPLECAENRFKVQVAGSLGEYCRIVSEQSPDIALLDMLLPDGNALELLSLEKSSFPMLILTSHGNEEAAVKAMKAGAQDYIVKSPETFAAMPRILDRALEHWQVVLENKCAAESIKISETRYRRLFETAREGILILDAETGEVIEINPFLVEMLGIPADKFVGQKILELDALKGIFANQADFEILRLHRSVLHENLPLKRATGQPIEVDFISNLYEVEHRTLIQCTIRDITQRRQAERIIIRLSSMSKTLGNVNKLIVHEKKKEELIQKSCDLLVESGCYHLAWILLLNKIKNLYLVQSAPLTPDSPGISGSTQEGKYLPCSVQLLSQESSFISCDDVKKYHRECFMTEYHPGGAAFAARLEFEGIIYGTITVDIPAQATMDEQEKGLFWN